jgi:hypothetical protein
LGLQLLEDVTSTLNPKELLEQIDQLVARFNSQATVSSPETISKEQQRENEKALITQVFHLVPGLTQDNDITTFEKSCNQNLQTNVANLNTLRSLIYLHMFTPLAELSPSFVFRCFQISKVEKGLFDALVWKNGMDLRGNSDRSSSSRNRGGRRGSDESVGSGRAGDHQGNGDINDRIMEWVLMAELEKVAEMDSDDDFNAQEVGRGSTSLDVPVLVVNSEDNQVYPASVPNSDDEPGLVTVQDYISRGFRLTENVILTSLRDILSSCSSSQSSSASPPPGSAGEYMSGSSKSPSTSRVSLSDPLNILPQLFFTDPQGNPLSPQDLKSLLDTLCPPIPSGQFTSTSRRKVQHLSNLLGPRRSSWMLKKCALRILESNLKPTGYADPIMLDNLLQSQLITLSDLEHHLIYTEAQKLGLPYTTKCYEQKYPHVIWRWVLKALGPRHRLTETCFQDTLLWVRELVSSSSRYKLYEHRSQDPPIFHFPLYFVLKGVKMGLKDFKKLVMVKGGGVGGCWEASPVLGIYAVAGLVGECGGVEGVQQWIWGRTMVSKRLSLLQQQNKQQRGRLMMTGKSGKGLFGGLKSKRSAGQVGGRKSLDSLLGSSGGMGGSGGDIAFGGGHVGGGASYGSIPYEDNEKKNGGLISTSYPNVEMFLGSFLLAEGYGVLSGVAGGLGNRSSFDGDSDEDEEEIAGEWEVAPAAETLETGTSRQQVESKEGSIAVFQGGENVNADASESQNLEKPTNRRLSFGFGSKKEKGLTKKPGFYKQAFNTPKSATSSSTTNESATSKPSSEQQQHPLSNSKSLPTLSSPTTSAGTSPNNKQTSPQKPQKPTIISELHAQLARKKEWIRILKHLLSSSALAPSTFPQSSNIGVSPDSGGGTESKSLQDVLDSADERWHEFIGETERQNELSVSSLSSLNSLFGVREGRRSFSTTQNTMGVGASSAGVSAGVGGPVGGNGGVVNSVGGAFSARSRSVSPMRLGSIFTQNNLQHHQQQQQQLQQQQQYGGSLSVPTSPILGNVSGGGGGFGALLAPPSPQFGPIPLPPSPPQQAQPPQQQQTQLNVSFALPPAQTPPLPPHLQQSASTSSSSSTRKWTFKSSTPSQANCTNFDYFYFQPQLQPPKPLTITSSLIIKDSALFGNNNNNSNNTRGIPSLVLVPVPLAAKKPSKFVALAEELLKIYKKSAERDANLILAALKASEETLQQRASGNKSKLGGSGKTGGKNGGDGVGEVKKSASGRRFSMSGFFGGRVKF